VLQSAGISGAVDLQYVVDTTGHAEPNSFKVVKATHPAFVEPAKEAILKGVFKPARYKGQHVRQLVQQRISFKVGS
jgi:TonB family protein